MPKRFHDTEQLEKEFFISMPSKYKVLFNWIEKKHDTAGIWDVNLAAFVRDYSDLISRSEIDLDEFIQYCNEGKERIIKVNEGRKLFLTTTINFQYGSKDKDYTVLNEKSAIKKGILNRLRKHPETNQWLKDQVRNGKIRYNEDLEQHKIIECNYCQQEFDESHIQKDHIVPKNKGGDDYQDNLVDACVSCNTSKGDRDPIEFIEEIGIVPTLVLSKKLGSLLKRGKIKSLPYPNPIGTGIGIGKGIETNKDSIPSKGIKKKKTKKENNSGLKDFYDATYERRLESKGGMKLMQEYWRHLKNLGWTKDKVTGRWNRPRNN